MTKPIIYQLAYSPYCIPITQALSIFGQEFETREVPNWERGEILKLTNGSYYGSGAKFKFRPDLAGE